MSRFLLATLFLAAAPVAAQTDSARADSTRSTKSGVFAEDQAAKGKDVYLGQCQSCHTAIDFTNAEFKAKWTGKPLAEFFTYLVENMPESEPGALSRDQYAQVTAYILQLNGAPAGVTPLSSEADSLKSIKIEIAAAAWSLRPQASGFRLQASGRLTGTGAKRAP